MFSFPLNQTFVSRKKRSPNFFAELVILNNDTLNRAKLQTNPGISVKLTPKEKLADSSSRQLNSDY
jgi:hypothetical protein